MPYRTTGAVTDGPKPSFWDRFFRAMGMPAFYVKDWWHVLLYGETPAERYVRCELEKLSDSVARNAAKESKKKAIEQIAAHAATMIHNTSLIFRALRRARFDKAMKEADAAMDRIDKRLEKYRP